MDDFTIVNLQDLTTATNLTVNDFLAIGQGSKELTKATIQQIGALIGVSSSVVLGNKEVEPTVPSFAFAEQGVYPEWGNTEIEGDLGILIYDGVGFSKTEINFIASGIVEQGNTNAVSGGEVFEKSILKENIGLAHNVIDYSNYIIPETAFDSGGNEVYSSAGVIVRDLPLEDGQTHITFSNVTASAIRKVIFKDSNNVITGVVRDLSNIPRSLVIPSGAVSISFSLKIASDSTTPDIIINYGSEVIIKETYIESIEGIELKAKKLSEDNNVPDPVLNENAVNLKYFNLNGLKTTDIELSTPVNLAFLGDNVINDYFITNSGSKAVAAGWKMLRVDISSIDDLSYISFGNFVISNGGWYAFYNEADNVMLQVAGLPGGMGTTVQKPAGAYYLYIDIQRPTGVSEYSEIQVNQGEELLPYTDPTPVITKIKGYTLESGSSNVISFEDLNDVPKYIGNGGKSLRISTSENGVAVFDAVEQNGTANLASLNVQSIALNLPTGAGTPPLGVEVGDAWIDTTDSSIKVKLA